MNAICKRKGHFPAPFWLPVLKLMRYRCLHCGILVGLRPSPITLPPGWEQTDSGDSGRRLIMEDSPEMDKPSGGVGGDSERRANHGGSE